ncbi:uncharacterized protein ACBR49_012759 isoform 2-T2 [Aulostomus maculatus]
MEVSLQDPSVMAMDLSKGYSVNSRTCSHTDAMDLAKKPEWYHRRPPNCSTEISSSYRSRASSSYESLSTQLRPEARVHHRDVEQSPEVLGDYMNSTLAPGLDIYHDGVHRNLWYPAFYGPDQSCGPGAESSGGEESDSGSDVIVLLSSAKEPLLCSSFIQDSVRHIIEPLSPAASSLDEGRGCYHLPQPLSSPSPESSYSEDTSESSVDIPVHHARPVVLLSDLSAVYRNHVESPVDISSDDSDVIEVSVTNDKKQGRTSTRKKNVSCKKHVEREPTPRQEKRSTRIRKCVSEMPQFTRSASRLNLRRRVKKDVVGMYYESCDSDDMMEYALRMSSSDDSITRTNVSHRLSSISDESDVDTRTDRKSSLNIQPAGLRDQRIPRCKPSYTKNIKQKKSLALHRNKRLRRSKQNLRVSLERRPQTPVSSSVVVDRKTVSQQRRKRCTQMGPSTLFSAREPEIKLRYASVREGKKEKKAESFCPFVRMERQVCTVVNSKEQEAAVCSGPGRHPTANSSPSGFVPSTSCYQLGRLSGDKECPASLLCCLCGQTANVTALGDLHGPYYPAHRHGLQQKEVEHGLTNSDDGGKDDALPGVHPDLDECWIHEDCGIWSAGIFLVRGKLYGLEEAARLAHETTCSTCQQTGAIMGCFQKGCSRNYHYRCATQSGCVLNEENFSMRCPEHSEHLCLKPWRRAAFSSRP